MQEPIDPQMPSIVFLGSGPVAADSLSFLAKKFPIEAVITKPQPPHHRQPFPVLTVAKAYNLPLYTPTTKQELSQLTSQNLFTSKLGVVVDYGMIIPLDVIDSFQLGIINSHFSLLPEWRGADPITFTVLSGQSVSGVTIMKIVPKLDEGDLLTQSTLSVSPHETTPSLTERLITLSNQTLLTTIPAYVSNAITPYPQDIMKTPSYSRKLSKQDGVLDFSKPAVQLEREIRAYLGWPGSRTKLADRDVIITSAHVEAQRIDAEGTTVMTEPGLIHYDRSAKSLSVATAEGWLAIDRLKPAGKAEMDIKAFLAGYGQLLS